LKHVKRRALNLRPRRDISRELLPPPHHRPRSRAPEPRDELPPSHSWSPVFIKTTADRSAWEPATLHRRPTRVIASHRRFPNESREGRRPAIQHTSSISWIASVGANGISDV